MTNQPTKLETLLAQAVPNTRYWITDAVSDNSPKGYDDACDDFVVINAPKLGHLEAKILCNEILEALGKEPMYKFN